MAVRKGILLLAGLAVALGGCRAARQIRDPEYAQVSQAIARTWQAPPAAAEAGSPLATEAGSPLAAELAGPQPLERYIRVALAQNAAVQAARKRVDAAALRVPQAASLKDPMLEVIGWPIYPNVPQTAAGRMTVDAMVSQEVPWFGKLQSRAEAAEAEANAARAQLAAVELKTIEEVKRGYYELYYAQEAVEVAQRDRAALANLVEVASTLYTTGKTSQQDVLRLQAELSNVDGELIRLRQMQDSARAALAQLLHVSPETPLAAAGRLAAADVPRDIERLYRQAVTARPELHALLADIARDRRKVELARLDFYPDVTASLGWGAMTTRGAIAPTADGIDNLTFGLSLNLPVYRQRLAAGVREAEATVVAGARQYDLLKDETQREVKQLFTQAVSQHELERLLRESIIPKTEQAFEIAVRGYQVGQVEFADLIANWRELLRFHLAHLQLEAQLRQTLAALERVLGGRGAAAAEEIPAPPAEEPPLRLPPWPQ